MAERRVCCSFAGCLTVCCSQAVAPYLEAVFQSLCEQRRNGAVVKNLRRGENLKVVLPSSFPPFPSLSQSTRTKAGKEGKTELLCPVLAGPRSFPWTHCGFFPLLAGSRS